jgi:hypothetical protein
LHYIGIRTWVDRNTWRLGTRYGSKNYVPIVWPKSIASRRSRTDNHQFAVLELRHFDIRKERKIVHGGDHSLVSASARGDRGWQGSSREMISRKCTR